jgi:membrane-bound lytic murein transglycosylase B
MLRLPLLALCLCATAAAAAPRTDFSADERTPQLLQSLKAQYAFTPDQLDTVRSALRDARELPQLIRSEQTNKEKTLTWEDYRPLHVMPANIENGLRFMREQKRWLDKAQERYGVPPEVVTALLGVETKYGIFTGKYRVLDSLVTLGYEHPSRAPFFYGELTQFFVLCRDGRIDPGQMRGSYAGAMGMAQFMPSNYRSLAVDFDGDGRADLWSPADAIGSVANYLVNYDQQRSWQRGQALLAHIESTGEPAPQLVRNAKLPTQDVGSLRAAGLSLPAALPDGMPAGLLELSHNQGPPEWWVALPNFYAVMSYNPRVFYAMAVASLAYELKLAEDKP